MDGEMQNMMNFDLNLGPVDQVNDDTRSEVVELVEQPSFVDWLNLPNFNINVLRQRPQSWQPWQNGEITVAASNIAAEVLGEGGVLHAGEGSVANEGRLNKGMKIGENNNGCLENEASRKKDAIAKSNGDEISFFDCNICFELAKDPVVTCCGHLFCWPCLYTWLHIHSQAGECPVCKGEVKVKNVTPIYGRGSSTGEGEDNSSGVKVPSRPQGRRVESWRQTIQRSAFAIPMEEMIRRLGTRIDSSRDLNQNAQVPHGHGTHVGSLLSRILTSRGLRGEQQSTVQPENIIDLVGSSMPTNFDAGYLLPRRSNLHQSAGVSNHMPGFVAAESYFQPPPLEIINQEPPRVVDDRDSMSSIAAVIHSESQTVDTAVEIQSNAFLSTSSSRRRNVASGISDMDTGESRAPRRRRLH